MTQGTTYTELEIGLHRLDAGSYQVELRFTDPSSEAEIPPQRGTAALDVAEIGQEIHDGEAYGKALATGLFHDENVRALYGRAKAATEAGGHALRIRLLIQTSALELQALRWELLLDPESKAPIASSEKTLFSRFMLSRDWRAVKLRPKTELKALVAVAAPSDLAKYQLADVDVEGEAGRATAALAGADVTIAGKDEAMTLEALLERLRDGVDVLYLVCHGVLTKKQVPYLLLQQDDGTVARLEAQLFAQAVSELRQPPRLVVLASCESGGTEEGTTAEGRATAESALAPRLAEAGVAAVVAMQGKISMTTVEKAMPVFFRELMKDGQIDRAMTVARATVRDRPDAWMPALYLRLKGGKIWYVPGFGGDEGDFSKWRSIVSSVRQGSFIPIVGTDVAEHVYGSARETAFRLAETHGFPLALHDRDDLTKVAQFLSVDESRKYARDEVLKQLHKQLLEHYVDLDKNLSLPKLFDEVVARREDDDPFKILTALPASVYVTASADPLLVKSLKADGKDPKPLLCDWRPTQENHPQEPSYDGDPSPAQPVVYHVFGALGKPASMVLTEDDFFDYMIATAELKLIPTIVRGTLTRNSLLFLGFRIDDWTFRVLFRLIMNLGGRQQLRDFAHVGVQVNPEESSLVDAGRARKYLEEYLSAGNDAPPISVYWGSAADFLKALSEQLDQSAGEEVPAPAEEDGDDWF